MKRGKLWPKCECGASHSKHIGELPSDCPDGYRPRRGFKPTAIQTEGAFKRFKPLSKKQKPMKKISDHRRRLNVAYEIVSAKVKEIHGGNCAVCGKLGEEIHHIFGRQGYLKRLPLLVNPLYLVWICRDCHTLLGRKKDDPRADRVRGECAAYYYKIINLLPETSGIGMVLTGTEDIIKAVRSIRK